MKSFAIIAAVSLTAAFFFAGCTQIERDGKSPIPRNTPPAWEINPYGDFGN